ncbi:hypothetical protein [Bifidobacterium saguinibicoloris]|uniref:hypothetical protein n=1 Tax=Bifidobacterium saguinibicoloris TaxID=2834433 RepID=UPI001C59931E|nr:hypothetical protein [Bifidobacterium saguinibicoloris]MBW3081185.1 hypothetical protein [Bifidobacterium saguinibicoloris]
MSSSLRAEVASGNRAGSMSVYLNKVTVRVITLLPLSTLLQAQPGFGAVNQMVIALSVVCFLLAAMVTAYPIGYWWLMLATFALTMFDVAITRGTFVNVNLVVYLMFWVLLYSLFSAKMDSLRSLIMGDVRWIRSIAVIWCVLVAISIPLPRSYYIVEGQGRFFCSFAGDSFRLSPTALLVLALITICLKLDYKNKWWYGLMSIVPLFCAFMGYSRTYLGVILLMYMLFMWEFVTAKSNFFISIVGGGIVAALIISVSSISSKIDSTSHGGYLGFWDTLTSGRSSFWAYDMQQYSQFGLVNVFFGGGFNRIYEINQQIGINIWAHNDFINLLVTNGVVGLLIYLIPLILLVRTSHRNCVDAPWYLYWILMGQWLINAFFNMEYTYVCAAIATAFALLMLTIPSTKRQYRR